MPGQHNFRRNAGLDYGPLFDRIEDAFDPSEMTSNALKDYLNAKTPGMNGLAEQLSQAKVINDFIQGSNDLDELNDLQGDILNLSTHKEKLLRDLEEKIISLSVGIGSSFAREKNITLSERTRAGIEKWKIGDVLVIRSNGKFKAWRKL